MLGARVLTKNQINHIIKMSLKKDAYTLRYALLNQINLHLKCFASARHFLFAPKHKNKP